MRAQKALQLPRAVRHSLSELRKMLMKTQVQVSEATGMAQGDVSNLEHQEDYKRSTLERYAKALGGRLRLFIEVRGNAWEIE